MPAKLLVAALAFAAMTVLPATAAEPPPIFVGGAFIRQHAIADRHGQLLVPVRGVFEALHADVTYTPPRFVVVRKNGGVIAGLIIGRNHAVVGNRARSLPAAPIRRFGRVYVPLRFVAEMAGATVTYSTRPRVVDIRLPIADAVVPAPARPIVPPPADVVPVWFLALVGAAVLGLLAELGRQLSVAARRPAKRPSRTALAPLAVRPLQLPYTPDAGDQHRIGQIRK